MNIQAIATIRTDFTEKFGVPRQSGMIRELTGKIVFEPKYRNPDALKGMQDFTHLWLIWHFSEVSMEDWMPMVRPPKLGGNTKMGVFATRSPFRPNHIGLSCVRLEAIDYDDPEGPVIFVSGVDMTDGTPILDIKPYLPYSDARPEASGGFTDRITDSSLKVDIPEEMEIRIPQGKKNALLKVLSCDPRPGYQKDPNRIYGMAFAGMNVRFRVEDEVLHVVDIETPRDYPEKDNK